MMYNLSIQSNIHCGRNIIEKNTFTYTEKNEPINPFYPIIKLYLPYSLILIAMYYLAKMHVVGTIPRNGSS